LPEILNLLLFYIAKNSLNCKLFFG